MRFVHQTSWWKTNRTKDLAVLANWSGQLCWFMAVVWHLCSWNFLALLVTEEDSAFSQFGKQIPETLAQERLRIPACLEEEDCAKVFQLHLCCIRIHLHSPTPSRFCYFQLAASYIPSCHCNTFWYYFGLSWPSPSSKVAQPSCCLVGDLYIPLVAFDEVPQNSWIIWMFWIVLKFSRGLH